MLYSTDRAGSSGGGKRESTDDKEPADAKKKEVGSKCACSSKTLGTASDDFPSTYVRQIDAIRKELERGDDNVESMACKSIEVVVDENLGMESVPQLEIHTPDMKPIRPSQGITRGGGSMDMDKQRIPSCFGINSKGLGAGKITSAHSCLLPEADQPHSMSSRSYATTPGPGIAAEEDPLNSDESTIRDTTRPIFATRKSQHTGNKIDYVLSEESSVSVSTLTNCHSLGSKSILNKLQSELPVATDESQNTSPRMQKIEHELNEAISRLDITSLPIVLNMEDSEEDSVCEIKIVVESPCLKQKKRKSSTGSISNRKTSSSSGIGNSALSTQSGNDSKHSALYESNHSTNKFGDKAAPAEAESSPVSERSKSAKSSTSTNVENVTDKKDSSETKNKISTPEATCTKKSAETNKPTEVGKGTDSDKSTTITEASTRIKSTQTIMFDDVASASDDSVCHTVQSTVEYVKMDSVDHLVEKFENIIKKNKDEERPEPKE